MCSSDLSSHTMTIFSDHKNLTYFRTAQKLNRRQARWSLYLSEFDVSLIHLPGSKMIQSDTLSQRPNYGLDNEHDNKDIFLLPDNLFINLLDNNLQKQITDTKEIDFEVKETLDLLLKKGPTNLQKDLSDWKMKGKPCYSTKERITSQRIKNYDETLLKCFMIMKQQDTQVN